MSGITRSRVKYEKICKHCTVNFTVPEYRKETALYCSRKCLALGSRTQVTSNCAICDKKFTHLASRANKAKYCSTKCYNKSQIGKGLTTYQCQHCHVNFQDSLSTKRKYCSKQCTNKSSKKTFVAKFSTVRKMMLSRGMIKQCNRCGFNQYPLILGVHHKDRNRNNNELSNLEVLCPNCHSIEHGKHTPHGFVE